MLGPSVSKESDDTTAAGTEGLAGCSTILLRRWLVRMHEVSVGFVTICPSMMLHHAASG